MPRDGETLRAGETAAAAAASHVHRIQRAMGRALPNGQAPARSIEDRDGGSPPLQSPAFESPTEVSTVALAAPATVLAGETVPPPATALVAPVAAATPASPPRVICTAERSHALSLSQCLSPPAHLPIPPRCDASPRRRVTALRRDDARRARAAMPRDAAAARGPDAA